MRIACLLSLSLALGATTTADAADGAHSEWVKPGPDEKLVYKTTEKGDRIMDFSHAGYRGGGVKLPDVPVKKTIKPLGDGKDDTAAIQAAIDEVAKLTPDADGFRGAVLLAPGVFTCARPITLSASGVVLRGSGGSGDSRSTIKMTGEPHAAFTTGRGRGQRDGGDDDAPPAESTKTTIADGYVPSGAVSFTVESANGFAAGDTLSIRKPVTPKWVEFMQMHDMSRNGKPQTWIKAGNTVNTERNVAAIQGNRITLDVPLSDSFDATYLNPPGAAVVKIAPPNRLERVGIESLHIESPPQPISHSKPHFTAIRFSGQDCWMRDLIIDETMNSVSVGGRRMTVTNVTVNRKARHEGSSRPAEFAPNGTQVLLDRCKVNADNVWFVAMGAGHAGPNVVLNCTFTGTSRAESHQRWSTGLLFDHCEAPAGAIELRNRGSMGSGHGWSMGWGVIWNCVAEHYIVQNPPGAMNWLIGSTGENQLKPRPFGEGPMLAAGEIDSPGKPVEPESLYLAQLRERLGEAALKNIGY